MKLKTGNILDGFTGNLADTGVYLRTLIGKTILQRCPIQKKKKKGISMPIQNRWFQNAMDAAALILRDPDVNALYKKVAYGTCSSNAIFVKDFLTLAKIAQRK